MSNVSFLRGLHASLPAAGKAIDGAFYLTTDSHRLYVGDSNKNLVDLNKYIITVASVDALSGVSAQEGDFYYAEKENALVLRKSNSWKLINQNTNTTNESASATYTVSAASDVATIKFEYAVTDDNEDSVSANDSFTITAGDNINLTADGKNLVIDGAKYSLSVNTDTANQAVFKLTNDHDSTSTSATVKAGTNVTISKDANGNVVIASKDTKNKSASLVLNDDNTLQFTVVDSDDNPVTSAKSPILAYKVNGTTIDLGEELPVYNKTQIDNKLNSLNGMTYKGTVGLNGTVSALPTTKVSSGDTYLVTGTNTVIGSGHEGKQGDLFIATGTEGTDGYLTSVTWTYVPSGDDIHKDTNYKFVVDATTNTIRLMDSAEEDETGIYTLGVESNGMLSISSTGSGSELTTTISHNKVTQSNSTSNSDVSTKFTAVKSVSVDEYGHVSGVETTTYELEEYGLVGSSDVLADPNSPFINQATLTTVLTRGEDDIASTNFHIDSTSLSIINNPNSDGILVNMIWGSF